MTKSSGAQDSGGPPRGPRRTCAVCRQEDAPEKMIRWVRSEEGEVFPDLAGKSFGRGAWTHPHASCLKDLRKNLARSFRAQVVTSHESALALLGEAANHRVAQLLGAARRQRLAVFGADAIQEAWDRGKLHLILVASDAQAAGRLGAVHDAVARGQACSWGTKAQLGALFGRSAVGVVGLYDRGLAIDLFGAIAMALLVLGKPESRADESPVS